MFVIVIVVGLAIAWVVRSGSAAVAEVGVAAPDFTVELIEGGTFTLSEARGRTVVVNLWASWCPPCRDEIPDISAFADTHPETTVVGVAVDDPIEENTREFAAEIAASYPLAIGNDDVSEAYPHFGLPATYVVDENGIVTEFVNGIVNEQILDDLVSGK